MVTCDTVEVQAETLAIDEIYSVDTVTASSNSPNSITVDAKISRNNRGPSEQRFPNVFVTLNGERVGEQSTSLPQGVSSTVTFEIADATPGTADVCVGVEPLN